MALTKNDVERLAEFLANKYNLTEYDLEALARELMTRENIRKHGRPFIKLMDIICDVDQELPENLTISEESLSLYSEEEMDLIVLILEIRFWYGRSLRLAQCDNFASWTMVFSVPRQIQRTLVPKVEVANVEVFVHGKADFWKQGWTQLLPRYFLEDFGKGYTDLRNSRFPGGIDDALDAFTKHYNELNEASRELERRLTLLSTKTDIGKLISRQPSSLFLFAQHKPRFELAYRCLSHCVDVKHCLEATLKRAKRWKKGVLVEREMLSLPGAMNGFRWGGNLTGQFHHPQGRIVVGNPHGKHHVTRARDSLLQFRVGSPWCEALQNNRLPGTWHMMWSPKNWMFPPMEKNGSEDQLGKIKIKLGLAAYDICKRFKDKDTNPELEKLLGPPYDPEKTQREIEEQGKQMSANSGMPYWKARDFMIDQESWSRFEQKNDEDPTAYTRKVHDAAGNLTLDFMAAMFEQIRNGYKPAGFRRDDQSGNFYGVIPK